MQQTFLNISSVFFRLNALPCRMVLKQQLNLQRRKAGSDKKKATLLLATCLNWLTHKFQLFVAAAPLFSSPEVCGTSAVRSALSLVAVFDKYDPINLL